jgi:hypothetical protein
LDDSNTIEKLTSQCVKQWAIIAEKQTAGRLGSSTVAYEEELVVGEPIDLLAQQPLGLAVARVEVTKTGRLRLVDHKKAAACDEFRAAVLKELDVGKE